MSALLFGRLPYYNSTMETKSQFKVSFFSAENEEVRKDVIVEVTESDREELWKLVEDFGYSREEGEPKFEKFLSELVIEKGFESLEEDVWELDSVESI